MITQYEAANYLTRFGYIDTPQLEAFGFARRKAFAPVGDVASAIAHFQRNFSLPVTGEMDDATLSFMSRPRCGMPDVGSFVLTGNKWPNSTISYRIDSLTPDIYGETARAAIADAFKLWRDKAKIDFVAVPGDAGVADIVIKFAQGEHGDGVPFDGPGQVLAHAFFPGQGDISGDTHFDEAEKWSVDGSGVDLVTVAAHEFGHALGLAHSNTQGALMYPYYSGPMRFLHADDIAGIQTLYGARVETPTPPPAPPPAPPPKARYFVGRRWIEENVYSDGTTEPTEWTATATPPPGV